VTIDEGRPPYHRLARTERYRWWKPLVELVVLFAAALVLAVLVVLPVFIAVGTAEDGAAGLITLDLSLAILLPAAIVAAVAARRPWRTLLSIEHRLRGRWLATCASVALAAGVVSAAAAVLAAALGHPLGQARGAWIGRSRFVGSPCGPAASRRRSRSTSSTTSYCSCWRRTTGGADRWITDLNTALNWASTLVDVTVGVLYAVVVARLYDRQGWSREPPQAPYEGGLGGVGAGGGGRGLPGIGLSGGSGTAGVFGGGVGDVTGGVSGGVGTGLGLRPAQAVAPSAMARAATSGWATGRRRAIMRVPCARFALAPVDAAQRRSRGTQPCG
jgi:hypothetical protein